MKKEIKVPFLDLYKINKKSYEEFSISIPTFLQKNQLILGEQVDYFEKNFAISSSCKYCVGVGNGLDALIISLKVLGIGNGDEVIVPANTYIATWLAITSVGAKIVPVEPNICTYNIEPSSIEEKINKKTKAIIPVHLYGLPCDMDPILEIANKHNLFIVQDAAQAHFSKYKNQTIGSIGELTAFSFYPGKNLGAIGDGGAVTTNNEDLFNKLKALRNYGSHKKYINKYIGLNSRLDSLQAFFLNIKMKYIEHEGKRRREIASRYIDNLKHLEKIVLPINNPGVTNTWHLFVIRFKERDYLREKLLDYGIQTAIHYPIPPHLQEAYESLGFKKGDFPISEKIHEEVISLPCNSSLSNDEIDFISESIIEACERS